MSATFSYICSKVVDVDREEEGAQYGALRDTTLDHPLLREYTVDLCDLFSIAKIDRTQSINHSINPTPTQAERISHVMLLLPSQS